MHGEAPERTAGASCGVVFTAREEKTLYIAGDTVYYEGVADILNRYHPEVVILNACGATMAGVGRLIMGKEDVLSVCHAIPHAAIIASHMEAVNHATVTREELKAYLARHGVMKQVYIPEDGESCEFPYLS